MLWLAAKRQGEARWTDQVLDCPLNSAKVVSERTLLSLMSIMSNIPHPSLRL